MQLYNCQHPTAEIQMTQCSYTAHIKKRHIKATCVDKSITNSFFTVINKHENK